MFTAKFKFESDKKEFKKLDKDLLPEKYLMDSIKNHPKSMIQVANIVKSTELLEREYADKLTSYDTSERYQRELKRL